jgi:hypothetical protein
VLLTISGQRPTNINLISGELTMVTAPDIPLVSWVWLD